MQLDPGTAAGPQAGDENVWLMAISTNSAAATDQANAAIALVGQTRGQDHQIFTFLTADAGTNAADPTTGAVTGTLTGTDPDGNPLTYALSTGPTKGAVTLNTTTGGFTYTPTAGARNQAAADGAGLDLTTDTFTITTTDGYGGATTTTITVTIDPSPSPPAVV